MEEKITPLGFYNFRNQKKKFGIKIDDRRRHIYMIGKTGVGKTTLLENMVIDDIRSGKGVGVIDPHGEFAEKVVDFIPEERLDDVVYFDPSDMDYPIAFNPMEQVGTEFRHLIASGIMGVFKKIWPDVWSARMEYILNNTLLALLELPGSTLLGIMRMLSEPVYRKKIVENLKDPVVKGFWVNEFARYTQRLETEAVAAIQNKVGQFIANPLVRNIMGQAHSTIDMRDIMDNRRIFIVNLSKGRIGEDNSALLGAMIITRLQLAAMSRIDTQESKRQDFFLYVDEFQNFATESFSNILSEARKYRLSLVLAHQYIGQLVHDNNTKVRDAIFGNVGTIIAFRIGAADSEFLEKEFLPEFTENDLVNLAKANVYVKLMIDGVASRPFSSETLPPQKPPLISYRDVIVKNSRQKYGTPKEIVETRIAGEWQTASESVIQEKVIRRDERPVAHVLRRDQEIRKVQEVIKPKFQQPQNPKQNINIDDFRKAINQSLNKPSEQEKIKSGTFMPAERKIFSENVVHEKISHREAAPVSRIQPPVQETRQIHPPVLEPRMRPQPPQIPKRDVNIDDLRRAISQSLNKVSEQKIEDHVGEKQDAAEKEKTVENQNEI